MDVIKKFLIFIEFLNYQQKNFSLARVFLKFHGCNAGSIPAREIGRKLPIPQNKGKHPCAAHK